MNCALQTPAQPKNSDEDEFDDDDFEFLDYGERVDATLNSQGMTFSNAQAGAREAIEIIRGARTIAAVPSAGDVAVLCKVSCVAVARIRLTQWGVRV